MLGRLFDIAACITPVDLQTAQTGKRIKVSNASRVCIICFKGVGTAADDPTWDVQQANAASGGTIKDLDVVDHYYLKDELALDGDEAWVKETQTAASEIADPGGDGTSAEHEQIMVIEIDPDTMDVANGFRWISINCADVGVNAQLGCALVLIEPAYANAPENMPATQ